MAIFMKRFSGHQHNQVRLHEPEPEPEVLIDVGWVESTDTVGLYAHKLGESKPHLLAFISPSTGHLVLCNNLPQLPGLSIDGQGSLDVDYYQKE